MKTLPLFFAICMMTLLGACDREPDLKTDDQQITDTQKRLLQTSNAFGVELLKGVSATETTPGNVFLSPLSISMALGMTANGAEGTTRDAMLNALQMNGLSISDANQIFESILQTWPNIDPTVQLDIANSIWYRQGFNVLPTFEQTNQLYFNAQVSALNFDDPNTVNVINDWVSDATNDKIPTIIDDISPEHVMFLINAVYFNAPWTEAFDPKNTQKWPFYLSSGVPVQTDMMFEPLLSYSYYSDNEVEVADIPYGEGRFSFTVLLPREGVTVNDVIGSLSQAKWDNWIGSLDSNSVPLLYLPTLEMEYEIQLKEVLTALGMGIAFTDGEADFSNLADARLVISEVKHKTYLKVDEAGTEAAAATSVGIVNTSAPPSMLVNKPYLIAIRERLTGGLLFVGKIENPTAN